MRLHAARGDRVRAMRAYHAYAAAAQRELGVVPSAAMRSAYEALLLDDDPRPPPRTAPHWWGRARARPARRAWRSARPGGPQLVLVTGEPGIGRAAWSRSCGRPASDRRLTAEARAYAAEGAVAYGPVIAWLRSAAIAPRLRGSSARRSPAGALLPALRVPGLPPSAPSGRAAHPPVRALAERCSPRDTPLLLVADDLQWFDTPTLQFLHYLLRSAPDAPLLVAATARREELDAGHPLAELVAGLQALGRCSEIALGRLGRAETAGWPRRLLGAPLDAARAERLFAASEGNPLHLVEAAQARAEAAAACRR